jgi:tetratricopeptide (TPR) repeat protein
LKEAFLLIEESLRLDPLNPATLDSLGWALLKQKEYEKGLNYLEKAYSINSQDGVITGHLADAYYLNGRTKEAIIYWKKALELEKKDHREIERIKNQLYKYNK